MPELTVRERIMQQLVVNVSAMSPANGNTVKWTKVHREPLDHARQDKILGNVISLYDNRETYIYEAGFVLCTLQVQVDYLYKVRLGQTASSELERLRGDLYRVLVADHQLPEAGTGTKLAIGIHMLSYDKDVSGPAAEYANGFMEMQVQYRHRKQDPHRLIGNP